VQGVSIAHTVRGAGRPVLLIHGWQGDHRYMQADVDAVFEAAGGWRRIYLDLPGHGQTAAPAELRSQGQVMSLLTGAVEALFPDRPFAVAGSSYGGYLTLGLVRSMPERLLGAALLVPDLPAPDGTRAAPAHVTLRRDPAAFTDLEPDEEWIPERLVDQNRRALEQIRAHDILADRGSRLPGTAGRRLSAARRAASPRPSVRPAEPDSHGAAGCAGRLRGGLVAAARVSPRHLRGTRPGRSLAGQGGAARAVPRLAG
jgi:pimeloyl-ACP methyl ester carboxylesterase